MRLLLSVFVLCVGVSLGAQSTIVTGNLNIPTLPVSIGGQRFVVTGTFADTKGLWFPTDIDTSMIMWKGNDWFIIDSLIDVSANPVSFAVFDTLNVGIVLTGNAQILELTPNLDLPGMAPAGDSDPALTTPPDQSALITYIVEKLDLGITADLSFDGNRNILRVPVAGQNLGTATIKDWLEWWYFVAPTMSSPQTPSTSVYEVGDSVQVSWALSTSNPGGSTLSNGQFKLTSPVDSVLSTFGAATSHADTIIFTPLQNPAGRYTDQLYTVQGRQDWVFGSESGTATTSKTIRGVYPVLYGMSATDYSDTGSFPGLALGSAVYTDLSKLVQTEGDKVVTLTGSGFIYYLVPKTWGDFDLSQILDHNQFDVTPSFTAYDVTVSSTGLTNDWTTEAYKMYKLNTTTVTSGFDYTFKR